MDLAGRTVVVTGGGGGIGRAAALSLADEGATVVIADRSDSAAEATASAVRDKGHDAHVEVCDLCEPGAVDQLVAAAAALGSVAAVVNAAGIALAADVSDLSAENWRTTIDTNLSATWFVCQAFIGHWRLQAAPGSIVNIASNNAFFVEPRLAAYCASKGGILALTRGLALECGPARIRVNCVCPGFVDTPLLGLADDDAAGRERLGRLHALGRIAQPAEIAASIVFLASQRSSFMTGAVVVVDGGMSIGVHGTAA